MCASRVVLDDCQGIVGTRKKKLRCTVCRLFLDPGCNSTFAKELLHIVASFLTTRAYSVFFTPLRKHRRCYHLALWKFWVPKGHDSHELMTILDP